MVTRGMCPSILELGNGIWGGVAQSHNFKHSVKSSSDQWIRAMRLRQDNVEELFRSPHWLTSPQGFCNSILDLFQNLLRDLGDMCPKRHLRDNLGSNQKAFCRSTNRQGSNVLCIFQDLFEAGLRETKV